MHLPPPPGCWQLKSWCAIATNQVRRDSLECSPRYNCTGHVHFQNCYEKGNNTEINSWYSLLQNIKENLMECLRWDHYKNPKFINWYHIHQTVSSQPPWHKEALSTFSCGEMSLSRKIYLSIITHDRHFTLEYSLLVNIQSSNPWRIFFLFLMVSIYDYPQLSLSFLSPLWHQLFIRNLINFVYVLKIILKT